MKDRKHSNRFNTPKDYFEDFEDRLFNKLSEDKLPKESGFQVPEGYFDQLEDTLSSKLNETEKRTPVIPLFSKRTLYYAAAIAACAVIIFSIINTNNSLNTIETLEISSIESYIDDGNLGLDYYDVASLLKEDDLQNITSESVIFSEETLEEYLLDIIDDSSILIE